MCVSGVCVCVSGVCVCVMIMHTWYVPRTHVVN